MINVSIRTTDDNENADIVTEINEEIESNNGEDSDRIIFDGKLIYNNLIIEDLNCKISQEINE